MIDEQLTYTLIDKLKQYLQMKSTDGKPERQKLREELSDLLEMIHD